MTIPFWISGGRTVDLLNIQPEDVTAEHIAGSLAQLNRFSGRCSLPWSVAAHSVLVERLCPPDLRPWALLHDAHESILGDVTTPAVELIAHAGGIPDLADRIAQVKGRIDRVIGAAWAVPVRSVSPEIRRADHVAVLAEATVFLDQTPDLFDDEVAGEVDRAISILMELRDVRDWRAARDLWLLRAEHYAHLGLMSPPRAHHPAVTANSSMENEQ